MALTDKEVELYDRQIRLWGVDAQQRLRGASVFIVGLSALGAEVTKNLVLAGFSVTLLDTAPAAARDLGAQFFLDSTSLGENRALASRGRAQDLNRLVRVDARAGVLGDEELRARPAPIVVLCDLPTAEMVATCARCRAAGAPVIAAGSFGLWGALFQDAGEGYAFERAAGAGEASAAAAEAAAVPPPPRPEAAAFKPLADVLQGPTFAALARNKKAQPTVFAWVGA
jgi:ubiquitin-like 1-activating enzyme E1 A